MDALGFTNARLFVPGSTLRNRDALRHRRFAQDATRKDLAGRCSECSRLKSAATYKVFDARVENQRTPYLL